MKPNHTPFKHQPSFIAGILMWGCLLMAGHASASHDLQLSYWLDTQGLAQTVRIGDVTGDGLQDVVVVNNGYQGGEWTNHLLIYPGNELGGLSFPVSLPYSTASTGRRGLVLLNADDDDALEVVVGHGRHLTLFNQLPDQSFTTTERTTDYANDVLISFDLDLDGNPELVSAQVLGQTRQLVFFDVDDWSVVAQRDVSALGDNFVLNSNDVNNDGFTDLLLLHTGSSFYPDLSVLLHDGRQQLLPAQPHHIGDSLSIASGLASGDYNADGLNDVLITSAEGQLYVLLQDAFGGLVQTDLLPIATGAAHVQSGDLNQDGLADVVMTHQGTVNTESKLGFNLQGNTGLQPQQQSLLPLNEQYELQDLTLGDINQDDCPDLALADYQQGLIIFEGVGCTAQADLSVQATIGNHRLSITGEHLSGLATQEAEIRVVIETPGPVRVNANGCAFQAKGRYIEAVCRIGEMQQGDSRSFHFWFDLSASLGSLHDLTITALISSEWQDPQPDNNQVILNK